MSVLIRGMDEIPGDGVVLVVKHDDNGKVYIKYANTYGYSIELVKLPEKHGRLIDADETLKRYCTGHCRKKPSCEEDCFIYDLMHLEKPVIEAEGE